MFGHSDDTHHDSSAVVSGDEPQHDAVLDNSAVTPTAPAVDDTSSPAYIDNPATPVDLPTPSKDDKSSTPSERPSADLVDADSADSDLLSIKQSALKQLSPLVGHLDQTPEEKFRTTMMMIQASDDQSLIKEAYAAAQNISDEKTKAQALLDIVNEINYFTQHNS